MKRSFYVFLLVFHFGMFQVLAQVSADCGNAIPICNNTPVNGGTNGLGTDDFNGGVASGCLEETISGTIESNSAWYRFRTGESGQLGFNIKIDTSEDWDFALYKSNDCANLGEPVRCNFFDNKDKNVFIGVGEDPSGNASNVQYDAWLNVAPGEDYYLLINNFSNNNSGFSIQFSGSIFIQYPYSALDCSIINNLLGPPVSACEFDSVNLDATTSDAVEYTWFSDTGNGFQEIVGEKNATFLVPSSANYRVVISRIAGNITSDVQVAFSTVPTAGAVSDDASCSGNTTYDLSQKDGEALGVQSPTTHLVSYHTSQNDAIGGVNALPKSFVSGVGSTAIFVRVTSLNNPKCFDASEQFQLTALETPILDFPKEAYLCTINDAITIGEINPNPDYTYVWDSGEYSSTISVQVPGVYTLTATNSQSGLSCSAVAAISVIESQPPQIENIIIEDLQNNNKVTMVVQNAADFEFRIDNQPYQSRNTWTNVSPGAHTVTVNDPKGCGEVTENIVVVGFQKFFTPNGDGTNADWNIQGLLTLQNPVIHIFDRYGKLLKQLNQNDSTWDGTSNGKQMPSSDYWFKLTYEDDNGQRITAKYVNNHFSLKR